MKFLNRSKELALLDQALRQKEKLLCLIGRRRIGKSRLLREWCRLGEGRVYVQAIESTPELQIAQLYEDLASSLQSTLKPSNWEQLLELLALRFSGKCLVLDEFPYLAEQDPSLPSRLQKRVDGDLPFTLILAGSSQTMMESHFLNANAPLYQRADHILFLKPMDFSVFCKACAMDPSDTKSFDVFSLVGGIPKYWEWVIANKGSSSHIANELFFNFSAPMNFEPTQLMQDERINSIRMKAVLDCIGRGDARPSQIASRMQTSQTHLSVPLSLLIRSGLVERQVPAGESTKNPKIVHYRLSDPALRFWFETYLVHGSRWDQYEDSKRKVLVHKHASKEFENWIIAQIPGASRFWNNHCEIDGLSFEDKTLTFHEVKYKYLSKREINEITNHYQILRQKFFASYKTAVLEIFDTDFLSTGKARARFILS